MNDNGKEITRSNNSTIKNIYDQSKWENINTNLRDLLAQKGSIRVTDIDFSNDKYSRHFFASNYIQKLPNGEKHERR